MLRIRDIKLGIDEDPAVLRDKVRKLLRISDFALSIERESLDARRRGEPFFLYTVNVSLDGQSDTPLAGNAPRAASRQRKVQMAKALGGRCKIEYFEPEVPRFRHGEAALAGRPLVMGFGPAGLFAAWLLAREGYRPIVFERGQAISERREKVEAFWAGQVALDPETNVQFGEGGAGTFSDGKLTSRSKDPYAHLINEVFVEHGAPEEILYSFQPHIGTDLLAKVIVSMREEMLRLGAEIHFNTKVTHIEIREGKLVEVKTTRGTFRGPLLMGIGHSARDTFRMLLERGVQAEAKAFAVGCRIEHPQVLIDRIRYGKYAGHPRLGAASYQVHSSIRDMKDPRNAYSFCMCPGGLVVAAASEEGRLVTNGMSYHARDFANANSAILTGVQPGRDFGSGLLDGVMFQEMLEEKAFRLGGGSYKAPVQSVQDFLKSFDLKAVNEQAGKGSVEATYRPGVTLAPLKDLFSEVLGWTLAEGLVEIDRMLPGFAGEAALLTGVESRSSSPIRFVRDKETRQSLNVAGLYPIGEGAGYAGGIVSAALDGLRSAEKLIATFAAPK